MLLKALKVEKTFPINHNVVPAKIFLNMQCNVCLLDISFVYRFQKMCHALAPSISSHGLLVFVVFIYFMDHYQARYELVWHSDLIYFMLVWVSLFSNQSLTFLFTALQALNCFKDKIKMYIYY